MRSLAVIIMLACGCSTPLVREAVADDLTDDLSGLPRIPTSRPIELPRPLRPGDPESLVLQIGLGSMQSVFVGRTDFGGTPSDYVWKGSIGTTGSVVITRQGANALGTIFDGTRTYRITEGTDGPEITPVPPATRKLREKDDSTAVHGQHLTQKTLDGPIRILAVYTANARNSCNNIEGTIKHAVALTNTVAELTRVSTRFEIATLHETDYEDALQSDETVLKAFVSKTDNRMDEIHKLRKDTRADIAILFTAPDKDAYDGLSAQTTASYETAFSIVNCRTAIDNYVMTHEIGHLLGLNDDDDVDSDEVYKNGFGKFSDDAAPNCWRTIMSTAAGCHCGCPVIQFWSNPAVHYPTPTSKATGVAGRSDNASVLDQTSGAISRFEPYDI